MIHIHAFTAHAFDPYSLSVVNSTPTLTPSRSPLPTTVFGLSPIATSSSWLLHNSSMLHIMALFALGFLLCVILALVIISTHCGKWKTSRWPCKRLNQIAPIADNNVGSAESDTLDVIVVGAGVAGSALAYALGKDGRKVFVIERDLSEPDRMVGEFLQPGGYLKLVDLGLADCVEDIDAQRVFGYALFKQGRSTKVGYPLKGYDSDVSGRSFHNGRFIKKMRGKASNLPTVTLQQGTVRSLIEEDGIVKGVKYRVAGGTEREVHAPLTVICDGCFSNLRRTLCTSKPEVSSCFVRLILENCDLPHANHGHVVLADPSPILFYPISSTEVRCLVDIPGEKVPSIASGEMASYLKSVVVPQVPEQLQNSFLITLERGNIRSMPNKSMPAFPVPHPGAILMGDAFNMRHPLTGGGMTVALSDIVLLRDLLRPLKTFYDAVALCDYLEKFYTLRKPVASTINTLAGALYKVFCASPDMAMKEMRQACFDYLSLGGTFSTGPVALLSGLNPQPLSLLVHFCAVAVFGVGRILIPFPTLKRLWLGTRLITGAANILFPIIRAEGVRQMFFPTTVLAYYKAPPAECHDHMFYRGVEGRFS